MVPLLLNPERLRKLAAGVLLVVMVFQFGACPCGCLEHNAWFEMLGLGDHHHDVTAQTHEVTVHDASGHDCTGERATEYFDSARLRNAQKYSVASVNLGSVLGYAFPTVPVRVPRLIPGAEYQRSSCAPLRPTLQVYLL